MNKRRLGSIYEARACEYIRSQGGMILERNFRCRQGEIDIVCQDGDTVAFVEVKYRRSRRFGYAEEAVDIRKQLTISQVASFYLLRHGGGHGRYRFDVIAIDRDSGGTECIRWHKDAFRYIHRG